MGLPVAQTSRHAGGQVPRCSVATRGGTSNPVSLQIRYSVFAGAVKRGVVRGVVGYVIRGVVRLDETISRYRGGITRGFG